MRSKMEYLLCACLGANDSIYDVLNSMTKWSEATLSDIIGLAMT